MAARCVAAPAPPPCARSRETKSPREWRRAVRERSAGGPERKSDSLRLLLWYRFYWRPAGPFGENPDGFGDALNDGVGTRRTPRDKYVNGNVAIQRAIHRRAAHKDVGGGRTGADRDHGLRRHYLSVYGLNGFQRIVGDRARDAQDVGVTGTALDLNAELFYVITRRQTGHQLDVAAVAASRIHVKEPWAAAAARTDQAFPKVHRIPPIRV